MNPPTKELFKLVLEERIAHGGNPVLRWNMDNIVVKEDEAGNIKPDKKKRLFTIVRLVTIQQGKDENKEEARNQ